MRKYPSRAEAVRRKLGHREKCRLTVERNAHVPWVIAKGRKYYRQSRRVNGRVVTTHVGRGPAAEAAATWDALTRQTRRAEDERSRHLVEPILAAVQALLDIDQVFADLLAVVAIRSGWYRHRRQWRRRRLQPSFIPPEYPTVDSTHAWAKLATLATPNLSGIHEPDRAALVAAGQGDPEGMKVAMRYLDNPEYRARWGDPMVAARIGLILAATDGHPIAVAAMEAHAREMTRELGWERSGSLERMTITRVIHNWLTVGSLEGRAASLDPTDRTRANVERCLTKAERRFSQAVRVLATLRRVSPAEIMGKVGTSPVAAPTTAPKATASGESAPASAAPVAASSEVTNRRSPQAGSVPVRPDVIPGYRGGILQ